MGITKVNWNRILLSRNPNPHRGQKTFTQISPTGGRKCECLHMGVHQTWVQFLVPSDQLCDVG